MPGNFTRGAKKLSGGGDGDGGGDNGEGEAEDNDAEVTYFSQAKDAYEGDVTVTRAWTRVAEEVRSVNPTIARIDRRNLLPGYCESVPQCRSLIRFSTTVRIRWSRIVFEASSHQSL